MDKIQKFFSDNWSVQRYEFDNAVALLTACLMNGRVRDAVDMLDKFKCSAMITGRDYMEDFWASDSEELPEDSIAIIKVRGMLYAWETEWIIRQLKQFAIEPNISGVVFDIDGPGGMTSHVEELAELIANYEKPTATVVTGVMASAHFWFGTAADITLIASKTCEVGSVGTMTTYTSFKKYYEQNGIESRDIYPDSADLKNKCVRASDQGDDTYTKERAARVHKIFAERVARNLGIAHDPEQSLFRGEMFSADQAVELGYIDKHGSVEDAVRRVLGMATSRKANSIFQ